MLANLTRVIGTKAVKEATVSNIRQRMLMNFILQTFKLRLAPSLTITVLRKFIVTMASKRRSRVLAIMAEAKADTVTANMMISLGDSIKIDLASRAAEVVATVITSEKKILNTMTTLKRSNSSIINRVREEVKAVEELITNAKMTNTMPMTTLNMRVINNTTRNKEEKEEAKENMAARRASIIKTKELNKRTKSLKERESLPKTPRVGTVLRLLDNMHLGRTRRQLMPLLALRLSSSSNSFSSKWVRSQVVPKEAELPRKNSLRIPSRFLKRTQDELSLNT